MSSVESELVPLQFPRIAALATSAAPAWLWSSDVSRILWANAVGAAIFGAADTADIGKRRFKVSDPAFGQIARLAATLPSAGQERLERLRGFGASFGSALTCSCARLVLPDCTAALLVAANEPAGPPLPLAERVRRLFPDGPAALAAFAPDGALLYANSVAQSQLAGAISLSALGIEALAAKALEIGHAGGALRLGRTDFDVTLSRLGENETRVLVLKWSGPRPSEAPASESTAAIIKSPTASEISITTPIGTEVTPLGLSISQNTEASEERRHPLRFVWQMDADGRFVVGSDEFVELVGPRTIAACGRAWSEIAAELKLDPGNEVARAIATRDTWSGIPISWPVDDTGERLPVELSALPVFDRDRAFRGYRGFGVCRDIDRLNQVTRARRARPIGFMPGLAQPSSNGGDDAPALQGAAAAAVPVAMPQPAAESELGEAALAAHSGDAADGDASAADNVVPFRAGTAVETKAPSLSPVERNAFRELAHELNVRLHGSEQEPNRVNEEQEAAAAPTASTAIAAATAQVAADVPPIALAIAADGQNLVPARQPPADHVLLDRVPAGVLIYRNGSPLYANRRFLEFSGYDDIEALAAGGGLSALFAEPGTDALADNGGAQKLSIVTRRGSTFPVEGRLFAVPWNGASALALILTDGQSEERQRTTQTALDAAQNEIRDLKGNLDRAARREAQKATAAKAEFLAKVSHEIRTPLNSMIGFAEVIMAERFGPIGNDRYREYLKDIHAAGTHIVSMLNDLLDLSKIETGQLELTFADVDLNDLTQQCVAVMQPHANRARIIIRTALAPGLRHVVVDERSLRQIVINLLANAIKFTGPGGQVIVSTATADSGEAVLRVRDTGVGMRETDIQAALEPFQQTASTNWGAGGIGLGLPLTKALAEANRANFSIKSAPNSGTLIEIAFPTGQAAAR